MSNCIDNNQIVLSEELQQNHSVQPLTTTIETATPTSSREVLFEVQPTTTAMCGEGPTTDTIVVLNIEDSNVYLYNEEHENCNSDIDSNIAIDEFELPDIKDISNSITSATPLSVKSPPTITSDIPNIATTRVTTTPQTTTKKKRLRKCNSFRIITLASLIFNVIAFLALIGLTINTYLSSNNTSVEILIARGDTNYYNTVLWDTAKLSVLTNDSSTSTRNRYTTNAKNFRNSLKNILNGLPQGFKWNILNGTNSTGRAPMFPYYDTLFNLTAAKKWKEARELYFSNEYQTTLKNWNADYQEFHESITKVGQDLDDYVFASSITNLVIIGISLAVVVPVIVFVFVLMVRKDGMAKNSLQSINSEMIAETMKDPKMRQDFKNHCMASNMSEYYSILEKMFTYSEICSEISELTGKTSNNNSNISNGQSSSSSSGAEQVQLLEKTKIEIAFEIIADVQESSNSVLDENSRNYISTTIDEVNNSLNERSDLEVNNLSPALFHDLEKEIQDQLLYAHYVFKHKNQSSTHNISNDNINK